MYGLHLYGIQIDRGRSAPNRIGSNERIDHSRGRTVFRTGARIPTHVCGTKEREGKECAVSRLNNKRERSPFDLGKSLIAIALKGVFDCEVCIGNYK